MTFDVGLKAILEPEFDEQKVDREVSELEDRLEALEGVDLDLDSSRFEDALNDVDPSGFKDRLAGAIGDAVQGQMDDGDGMAGEAAAAAAAKGGKKAGMLGRAGAALSGAGGAAAAAGTGLLTVALGGVVALAMLKGIQKMAGWAPRGRKMVDMFSEAMSLFFRPFGDLIGKALMPHAADALKRMAEFNMDYHKDGLKVALWALGGDVKSWLKDSLTIGAPGDIPSPEEVFDSFEAMVDDFEWGTFIDLLEWSVWLNPLAWNLFIVDVKWKEWIDFLSWDNFISAVKWSMLLNPLTWSTYVVSLAWDDWLDPVDLRNWVTGVDIRKMIDLPDWMEARLDDTNGETVVDTTPTNHNNPQTGPSEGPTDTPPGGITLPSSGKTRPREGLMPFASGGIVKSPTRGIVGEAGPEAILPLDKLGQLMQGVQDATRRREPPRRRESPRNHSRGADLGSLEERLDALIRAVRNLDGETRVEVDGETLVKQEKKAKKRYTNSREVVR